MNIVKLVLSIYLFLVVGGCVAANDTQKPPTTASQNPSVSPTQRPSVPKKLPSSYALPGTSTAVVGIAIDKNGVPQETVSEIVLLPGQKVVLAGPDRFQVVFKNKKTPIANVIRQDSKDGIIMFSIPKDILDRGEFVEEFKRNNFVRFDYSIVVNGKELDPPLIIRRDY